MKVSGDEYLNPLFQRWIKRESKKSWVVVCVGGGTQINEAFAAQGLPVGKHGPLGREIDSFEERQLARDILEKNQIALEDCLAGMGIHVAVAIPVINIGEVLCHINGDQMVRNAYLGFDQIYVVTTRDRLKKKKVEFAELPKVIVKSF